MSPTTPRPLTRQRPSFTIYRDEPAEPSVTSPPPTDSLPASSSLKTLTFGSKENTAPYVAKSKGSSVKSSPLGSRPTVTTSTSSSSLKSLPSINESLSEHTFTSSLTSAQALTSTRTALGTKYVHPTVSSPPGTSSTKSTASSRSKAKSSSTSSKKLSSDAKVKPSSSSRSSTSASEKRKSSASGSSSTTTKRKRAVMSPVPEGPAALAAPCALTLDDGKEKTLTQNPLGDISAAFPTSDVPEGYVGHYSGLGKKRSRAHTITSRETIPRPSQPEEGSVSAPATQPDVFSSQTTLLDVPSSQPQTLVSKDSEETFTARSLASPHKRVRLSSQPAPEIEPYLIPLPSSPASV